MYICLCNALTAADVERAVSNGAEAAREIYIDCGCRARCGSCVRFIQGLLRDSVATAEA